MSGSQTASTAQLLASSTSFWYCRPFDNRNQRKLSKAAAAERFSTLDRCCASNWFAVACRSIRPESDTCNCSCSRSAVVPYLSFTFALPEFVVLLEFVPQIGIFHVCCAIIDRSALRDVRAACTNTVELCRREPHPRPCISESLAKL